MPDDRVAESRIESATPVKRDRETPAKTAVRAVGSSSPSLVPSPGGRGEAARNAIVEDWIARSQGGDRTAFGHLVERYKRAAGGIAYSILREEHLAADAVQEAFFKAFQRLGHLLDTARFEPWFMSIVRSTATDLVRRRIRWGSREVGYGDEDSREVGSQLRSNEPGPPERADRLEDAKRMRSALESLREEYREVIILKHMEGRSYRDISRLLKISVRAVESRLFRARQQLSRRLGGDADDRRASAHPGDDKVPGAIRGGDRRAIEETRKEPSSRTESRS